MARKHPPTFSWGSFLPAIFWAGVIVGPIVCTVIPRLWPVYGGVIALYLLAIIMESARIAWRSGRWNFAFRLPVVFLVIHFGAAAGALCEFLRLGAIHPKLRTEAGPSSEARHEGVV